MDQSEIRLKSFHIKPDYHARNEPEYFVDNISEVDGITHQPEVYPLAAHLGAAFQCSSIIDIGCGRAKKLTGLHPQFSLIGIDFGSNLDYCRTSYNFGSWLEMDFEKGGNLPLERGILEKSVVICADVIEHLVDPTKLLKVIGDAMEIAPVGIVTTPERDLVRGFDDVGPPGNPCHVREWNLTELASLFRSAGIRVSFQGLTFNNDKNLQKRTSVLLLENGKRKDPKPPPLDFRVTAIMTAYNEEDIIENSIAKLIQQGIHVHVIENWSTDSTYERVMRLTGTGEVSLERFPASGPSKYYEWRSILKRVEQVSRTLHSDWIIHHDVDEVRASPWSGVTLRNAIHQVDQWGYNAIDHTCTIFHPVDDGFAGGVDFEEYFGNFEFGTRPGHFLQVKAWKNTTSNISLAESGGHQIEFPDRKVFPFKFLLKHYPIRSQRHGLKKILTERAMRWDPEERAMGWHTHYDHITPQYNFLRDPSSLEIFRVSDFYQRFLVERLSGVGIVARDRSERKE